MNFKNYLWIGLAAFGLNHWAVACYISDRDELGDIAARYDLRDQVKGVPSLKIDFNHLPPDVSSIYDQFKQAYIHQNQFHIRVLHTPSHEFDILAKSMCDDVYKIHYDHYRITQAENEGFQQGACNVTTELVLDNLQTIHRRHECFQQLSIIYTSVDQIDRALEKLH